MHRRTKMIQKSSIKPPKNQTQGKVEKYPNPLLKISILAVV